MAERRYPNDGGSPQVTSFTYDPVTGALTSAVDAEGEVTTYESAPADWLRPKKVTHPDGRVFEILS